MDNCKALNIANFNVTFGPDNDPMLSHFSDIIYPAMCTGLKVKTSSATSYFSDIELKEIQNEFILTGNLIRESRYIVRTVVIDDKLIASPSSVPTAPYSRFLVFLKNHRMVLIKNEARSPNIKSFQSILRKAVSRFTRDENRRRRQMESKELPNAIINIVNMPLTADIREVLSEFDKINSLKLRFFPLNNDIDSSALFGLVRSAMKDVDSQTSNLVFNSPQSPQGVSDFFSEGVSSGLTAATIKGKREDGTKLSVNEDQLSSEIQIPISGNLGAEQDAAIFSFCEKNDLLPKASLENQKIYQAKLELFKTMVEKL